jgi:hypothetical protein
MFEIDRSLMVVRPKQPFLDWVLSVDSDESITLESVREDPSAYLIPEICYDSDQQEILEWCYMTVFEGELNSWFTDPQTWPQKRDLKVFLDWFDIDFHSGVFDLCDAAIQVIDYELDGNGTGSSEE